MRSPKALPAEKSRRIFLEGTSLQDTHILDCTFADVDGDLKRKLVRKKALMHRHAVWNRKERKRPKPAVSCGPRKTSRRFIDHHLHSRRVISLCPGEQAAVDVSDIHGVMWSAKQITVAALPAPSISRRLDAVC
jgi:hypothetical protein